jgi:hypothetical protein
VEEFSVRFN